jgi:4-methyl-5(b-hydroxyethyl)-thiazole monophosphate biosynthesis
MAKVAVLAADGCEECEALIQVDLLRRAGITVDIVSITGKKEIESARQIRFLADYLLEDVDRDSYDGVILPGGMPGTLHLKEDERVLDWVRSFAEQGKLTAAICAAPTVLGAAGILEGKKATCYPQMEDGLTGAQFVEDKVAVDGAIITSRGLGTAIDFGLALIAFFFDDEKAQQIGSSVVHAKN